MNTFPEHPGRYLASRGLETATSWVRQGATAAEVVAAVASAPAALAAGFDPDDKIAAITILSHRLDWWLKSSTRAFKMWSGNQHVLNLTRRMQKALRTLDGANPFSYAVAMTGRFGFDPAAGWTTLDVGYSPKRVALPVATYPAVELFALIGLQDHALRHVANGRWEYDVDEKSYRFGLTRRGRYKALSWAEEVHDDSAFRYVGPRW